MVTKELRTLCVSGLINHLHTTEILLAYMAGLNKNPPTLQVNSHPVYRMSRVPPWTLSMESPDLFHEFAGCLGKHPWKVWKCPGSLDNVRGQSLGSPWKMSRESMDNVQSVQEKCPGCPVKNTGHCLWTPWTLCMDYMDTVQSRHPGFYSMGSVDFVHGQLTVPILQWIWKFPGIPWTFYRNIQKQKSALILHGS